jgi:hypothetical protein
VFIVGAAFVFAGCSWDTDKGAYCFRVIEAMKGDDKKVVRNTYGYKRFLSEYGTINEKDVRLY